MQKLTDNRCTFANSYLDSAPFGTLWHEKSHICLPDKRGFFLLFGAKYSENKQKQLKTGVGTVIAAAPSPVFVFAVSKIAHYFLYFFTAAKNEKKRRPTGFEYVKMRNNCNKLRKATQTH